MIANDAELRQTREQLALLEEAIAELRRRVYPQSIDRFRLMAESYLDEVERLRNRIDEYLGIKAAREAASDFVLRIESEGLPEGTAPAPVLTDAIRALQRGLQKMGEYIARRAMGAREEIPARQLAKKFELEVIALVPGSFEVGLRVHAADEQPLPQEITAEAIQQFNRAVSQVGRLEITRETFRQIIPNLDFQLQVLYALRDLAPPRTRKELNIGFQSRFLPGETVTLKPEVRLAVSKLIRATIREAEEEGVVREIDLDKRTFKVRTEATTLRCRYRSDLEELVKESLDRRVRVAGRASGAPDQSIRYLTVTRLSRLRR